MSTFNEYIMSQFCIYVFYYLISLINETAKTRVFSITELNEMRGKSILNMEIDRHLCFHFMKDNISTDYLCLVFWENHTDLFR